MALALAVLVVLILLCVSELWWRHTRVHGELSRKFVHITVGSFVAFWPFFLSWKQIELISVAFLVGTVLSKSLHIFQAIHSVQRPTWGEIFFALAVGGTALITHDKWIYMAALLQMSLADGLAAIVGTRYGKGRRYLVFGHAKSLAGTATFLLTSLIIVLAFSHLSGAHLTSLYVLGLVVGSSLIENLGVFGLDNVLVPLLVALSLRLIT
jgi:phytol kinase